MDTLYFLIYEGSGNAKRLTELMTDEELTTVWWIKTLRTSIRHDVDHGDERKSKRKHLEIGEVYSALWATEDRSVELTGLLHKFPCSSTRRNFFAHYLTLWNRIRSDFDSG